MSAELSQYELERLERIKRNHAMMASIGIDVAASQMRSAEPKPRKPHEPKVRGLEPQRPRSERSAAAQAIGAMKRQIEEERGTDELGHEVRRHRSRPIPQSYVQQVGTRPIPQSYVQQIGTSNVRPLIFNSQDRQIVTELVQPRLASFAPAQLGELFAGHGHDLW